MNYIIQVGILIAGGYNEGRFTMFYPFSPDYIRGAIDTNRENISLGTSEGWVESGWLPDDRKVGFPICYHIFLRYSVFKLYYRIKS